MHAVRHEEFNEGCKASCNGGSTSHLTPAQFSILHP